MARKKRTAQAAEPDILLPQVPNEDATPRDEVRSEAERRAEAALESIERDLFGTITARARVKQKEPAPQKSEMPSRPTPVVKADKPSAASHGIPALGEMLSDEDEGEILEHAAPKQTPPLSDLRRRTLTETPNEDFKFLLDMDYEDELGNTIGFEKIKAYHEQAMNGRVSAKRRGRNEREFESQSQDATLRREYAKQKTGRIVHLVLSLVLLFLLMIYERPTVMARLVGGPVDGALYPTSYILLGMQLLVLAVALSYQSLWEGFVRLLRFSPMDYSFTSVLVIVTFVYHTVLLFIPCDGYPALYLSPLAFCLALLSLVEFLNWYRESLAFDVVAASRQKYGIVPRASVGSKRDSAKERLFRDAADGEEYYYIRPVGFVRNYVTNTAQHMEHHRNLGAQLILTLAFGVAIGLFALAGAASNELVLRTVFATVLLAAPTASLLLTSVPMFFAAILRLRGKSAIIGERPVAQSISPATIVLPDDEVFSAMEHEHFHLMENGDLHSVSVLTRALLEKVGSPLAEAFSVDVGSRISPDTLTLTDIASDGVAAAGNDGAQIFFGTISYMKEHGIPVRGLADDVAPSVANRLLCVAMNGKISALFLVRYRFTEDIRALLRELDRAGIPVAVRSKDPCVRTDVFARLLAPRARSVQVIKPSVQEMELRTDRVDTTVVALDSCKEVARAYVACRRIRRVGVWGKWLQTLSMVTGVAIAALLALFSNAPSALFVTAWLMIWGAFYTILSYTFLRPVSDESEEEI